MKRKDNTEKICPCGRIITDKNNKTGLCPRCQKAAEGGAAAAGMLTIGVLIKKFGPKILRFTGKFIKGIIK